MSKLVRQYVLTPNLVAQIAEALASGDAKERDVVLVELFTGVAEAKEESR